MPIVDGDCGDAPKGAPLMLCYSLIGPGGANGELVVGKCNLETLLEPHTRDL